MSCKCPVCKGASPQTRLWCLEHKRHVHDGHSQRHIGHRVVKLDPWPPKRRIQPTRRLSAPRTLPATVDLTHYWTDVKYPQPNQSSANGLCGQGCCTAETLAFDVALMKSKQGIYTKPFSAAFGYWGEREDIGTFPEDSGANMVDEGNALAKHGICYESTMPFDPCRCDQVPTSAAKAEAAKFKCDPNQQAIDYRDFQSAIYNCEQAPLLGSVRVGYPVPQSVMDAADNGGFVRVPGANDSVLGGHSEEAAVYDMKQAPWNKVPRLYVGLLQSWGKCGDMSAGLSRFWFPYPEFFESEFVQNNYGIDAYQQPDLPSGPAPPHHRHHPLRNSA